jgi:hypothetical protein
MYAAAMDLRQALALGSLALVALAGCSNESVEPVNTGPTTASSTGTGAGGAGGDMGGGAGGESTGGAAPVPLERATISGELTWQVTFDADAQAAGATDCSYTRTYQGVEDRSAPWRCPACDAIFHADVVLTAGASDCFPQLSPDAPPDEAEWIGYGDGVWYRGSEIAREQGTARGDETMVAVANAVMGQAVPAGGLVDFTVAGNLTLGKEEGDPDHGFVAPASYACGWPKADPPPYQGDYLVAIGKTMPDGLLLDACEEPVRLHDFQGRYLLLKMSARDCVPCQAMAKEEEAWVADLGAQGVDVQVITLLARSLAQPLAPTSTAMLEAWATKFDLTSPILGDRALGAAIFLPLYPETLAYPSWLLVDPDLRVMQYGSGFGGFEEITAAVLADTP